MVSPIFDAIYKRRSIREYTDEPVTREQLHEIITAGIWAPSGLNNQPWRFVTILDESIMSQIADQTHYSHIVLAAKALIVLYIDKNAMYDDVKDHQAAGACIQNMLLAVEALDLGSVWLGQILNNKDKVNAILCLEDNLDLMAVLAIGHPLHDNQKSTRKELSELIIHEF